MEEKREDGRKHNGGRREGAGRPKMQLIDRRLQRRLYCTQEEYDWVLEQLDKRRAKKGVPLRSRRNDQRKKIIT